MSNLVEKADIVTPNLTEVGILLNEKYIGESISIELLKKYLNDLCNMGRRIALITGVLTDEGEYINACYNRETKEYWKVPFDYVNKRYPGTGDLYTSLFAGYYLNGNNLPKSMEKASIFVTKAVRATYEAGTPSCEGVIFEKIMKELYVEPDNFKFNKM